MNLSMPLTRPNGHPLPALGQTESAPARGEGSGEFSHGHRTRRAAIALLLGLALVTAGCSSFNRDWKAARDGRSEGLEGRWQGTWRSDITAHTEQLRCLITPSRTNGVWDARFQAKYRKLIRLTFSYAVPLTVTNEERGFQFAGAADLGWLAGGRYTYRGRATATNFFSTYESQYDRGIFEMMRPLEDRPMPAPGQR